MLYLLGLWARF